MWRGVEWELLQAAGLYLWPARFRVHCGGLQRHAVPLVGSLSSDGDMSRSARSAEMEDPEDVAGRMEAEL